MLLRGTEFIFCLLLCISKGYKFEFQSSSDALGSHNLCMHMEDNVNTEQKSCLISIKHHTKTTVLETLLVKINQQQSLASYYADGLLQMMNNQDHR